MTAKSVVLRQVKDGTRVFLVEKPAALTDPPGMKVHTYDLGRFNAITAKAAQARLQFRFARAGEPLTPEEVAEIQREIRRHPL